MYTKQEFRIQTHTHTYIGIELPDKAREIVVFEASGKKIDSKGLRIPDNETVVTSTPRDYLICVIIFYQVVGFAQKWWGPIFMKPLNWLRNFCYI